MGYKITRKVLKGKEMYGTCFGVRNRCSGMYSGGQIRYLFGIKYIFGIEIIKAWGSFRY